MEVIINCLRLHNVMVGEKKDEKIICCCTTNVEKLTSEISVHKRNGMLLLVEHGNFAQYIGYTFEQVAVSPTTNSSFTTKCFIFFLS